MKNFIKGKFGTVVIILITVILAGIAVFTAYRLYQLRQQPVAPNVPSSFPKAEESESGIDTQDEAVSAECHKTYTVTSGPTNEPTATPTINPTATPTINPTATPTEGPGEPNSCGGTCGSNSNCKSGLYCYSGYCRNPSCPTDTDCECPGGGSNPTATPTSGSGHTNNGTTGAGASPTEAALPQSGTNWPTFVGTAVGILVIMGSLLLAF